MTRRSRTHVVDIREVARAAGVSPTTVSHALNGKGRISAGTRANVQAVAARLGYRANTSARTLARRKTGLLLLNLSGANRQSLPMTDLDYFVRLLNSATQAALARGYSLVLSPPITTTGAELRVDGAVVIDPIANDPLLREFRRRRVPVVTRGRDPAGDHGVWVDNDFRAGTERVLNHLLERGARRVALITGHRSTSFSADTCDAYEAWQEARGMRPIIKSVGNNVTESSGYNVAMEMLDGREPPDAIYALFDRLALGALLAARTRGISVPEDLMLVALTESAACRNSDPPVTTLSAYPDRLGRLVSDVLIDLIEDLRPVARQTTLGTRLIRRASTQRVAQRLPGPGARR